MKRRIFALLLVSAIVCLSIGFTGFAADANPTILPSEDILRDAIQPLIAAQQDFYYVQEAAISNIAYTENDDGTVDTTFDLCLTMELKASSVSDLPYVQGMLEAIGVSSVEDCSVEAVEAQLTRNQSNASFAASLDETSNAQLDASELSQIITEVIAEAETYSRYIGAASDFYFSIMVTTDSDGSVTFVGGGTYSDYIPIEEFFPATEHEMKEEGSEDLMAAVTAAVQECAGAALDNELSATAATTSSYKRVSARDYANTWTSTVTVSPYYDESKYNPAYDSKNDVGGDCANYVSQAIYEGGGIATTTTWYPYSSAWVSTSNMKAYFLNTAQLWTESNITNCNAGGVLIYCNASGNPYHVTMCVHNDTVTRKFSGHNKDRKEVTYTSDASLTGNSSHSIEYYVFTNSVDS